MYFNKNKSFLAPQADSLSSLQLNFLLLNCPFTVIFNNYKSNLRDLNSLRALAFNNNGFAYHPNKNVKTRAFKEFNTVLSFDVLNGLVVFVFFKDFYDLKRFIESFERSANSVKLSYFALLVNGHIADNRLLNEPLMLDPKKLLVLKTSTVCNKILLNNTSHFFSYLLNNIFFILNAYTKSIN